MNRYWLITFIVTMVFFGSCSSSKTIFNPPRNITGEIVVIGNEPFTNLAVRVEGGETYLIKCSEEIKKSLLSNQGKIAEVFYDQIEKKSTGDEIRVTEINFLSK